MAIITNIINGMTEISASSGKYLTQSYPTNFHEFYSKKMILPDDSVDNYKEVTEAEKTQIETQDAKWEEPSKELIERWNEEWWVNKSSNFTRFGKYNPSTGFFEGNDILDISTQQARIIDSIGTIRLSNTLSEHPGIYAFGVPTIIPLQMPMRLGGGHILRFTDIKVARIVDYKTLDYGNNPATNSVAILNTREMAYMSHSLEEIKAIINVADDTSYARHFYNGFENYGAMKELRVINLFKSIYLGKCSNFNIDCVDFMVENAKTVDAGQTITLHPNVYAKVSDELFGKASNKNITIATTE